MKLTASWRRGFSVTFFSVTMLGAALAVNGLYASDTQSPNYAASIGVGTQWSNPTNAKTDNGSYATVSPCAQSEKLKTAEYGFSVPGTADVTGVVVHINGYDSINMMQTCPDPVPTTAVKLTLDDVLIGNLRHPAEEPYLFNNGTEGTVNVPTSSTSDLWGNSLVPADVNDSSFGASLWVEYGYGGLVSVDHISMTVYYDDSEGHARSQTRKPSFMTR